MRSILKGIGIALLEFLGEAVLLGCLGATLTMDLPDAALFGPIGMVLSLPAALFLRGYWITRLLSVTLRKSRWRSLYPAVATASFVVYSYLMFSDSPPSAVKPLSAWQIKFIAGGAGIVLLSSYLGNRTARLSRTIRRERDSV